MDPAVRGLMEKITASVNPDYSYHGQVRMTVRTKADAELVRELGRNNTGISLGTPVTHDEIVAKFNRVFAFMRVSKHAARACVGAVVEPARRARHRRADREPGAVRLAGAALTWIGRR